MVRRFELEELLALYQELGEVASEPSSERRRHARSVARRPIPATVELDGGMAVKVSIRDLSRSGIGLFMPNPIRIGACVVVTFQLGAGAVRAVCRVANCREDETGQYVVGMAFIEVCRVPPPAASDLPEGQMRSAAEAMEGADIVHVDDVVRRLRRTMYSS